MAEDIVSIKGSKDGLIISLNTYHELEELKNCLIQKFESATGFFQGAHFFLKPRGRDFTVEQRTELETLCKEHGLIPSCPHKEPTSVDSTNISRTEISGVLPSELKGINHFVHGSIRNGQKKNYQGNVILHGDVNPGGEITATGSIIIMGTLKGIAHGGADGKDTDSFIMAFDFRPHQIRIAQTVARNPDTRPLPTKTPEIARLINDVIVIERYHQNKFKKIG
ncbi:MAG: hypothetical protein MI748_18540, partial [Opitutales bacterium]|nr:hypothetical protein [Opitutales bacterium]